MTVSQDHLRNDPTEVFLQLNPHTAMLFSPFGCIYQPTSPCPTLSAHTEHNLAGSDITNCLTHTMYAIYGI